MRDVQVGAGRIGEKKRSLCAFHVVGAQGVLHNQANQSHDGICPVAIVRQKAKSHKHRHNMR